MNKYELTKRNAIIGDDFVTVGIGPFSADLQCKRCGEVFQVPHDAPPEKDPTHGHCCVVRPLNPALHVD